MKYLYDTNILSELARPLPNKGVVEWSSAILKIYVSVITAEEIYFGLSRKPNTRISAWIEIFLKDKCRILPITAEIAKHAGQLRGNLSVKGLVRTQLIFLLLQQLRCTDLHW
jgi:predicted nucleic acid-binding protein